MKLDPEQLKAIEHTGSQKTSSILRCERVHSLKHIQFQLSCLLNSQ